MQEFIILRQGHISVEEYSLKFTHLSKYAPFLVSNPRDKMSRLVMGVADLLIEECGKTIIHGDMNLSRLMVYAESIEESKHSSLLRNMKRGRSNDHN